MEHTSLDNVHILRPDSVLGPREPQHVALHPLCWVPYPAALWALREDTALHSTPQH